MEDNLGKAFTSIANEQWFLLRYEATYRCMYDGALRNLLKLREKE